MNQPHKNCLKIIAWNINGVKTKLEKKCVQDLILIYDVVSLDEVKTALRVSLPGYVAYRSESSGSAQRGGTMVFSKNDLSSSVFEVGTSIQDQVWLRLRDVADTVFGFVYVPPRDSPYFTHISFSAMQEKMLSQETGTKYCILGDLNARFGVYVRELPD